MAIYHRIYKYFTWLRFRAFIIISLCLLTLSSCVTKSLWDQSYNETFRQFVISEDGRMTVFLGSKYHYIFSDNTGILQNLLNWPSRRNIFINSEESRLDLGLDNIIIAEITVESYFSRMPPEDYEFLRALGFRAENKSSPLKVTLKMRGKRYLPRTDLGYNLSQLERSYMLPIHYKTGSLANLGKIAITPITIAADSLLIAGTILLAPFRGQ